MNKEKALQRLSALENEAAELRKVIEAPEVETQALVKRPPVGDHARVSWLIMGSDSKDISTDEAVWFISEKCSAVFCETQQPGLAKRYAEAINTLIELRRQPGSCDPGSVSPYAALYPDLVRGTVQVWQSNLWEIAYGGLAPVFRTTDQAEAAINAVGKERIVAMCKTLHGVE